LLRTRDGLDHGAGADAAGANRELLDFPGRELGADRLQIGVEPTLASVVGVADVVADLGRLPADVALLAHGCFLLKYGVAAAWGERLRCDSSRRRAAPSHKVTHTGVASKKGYIYAGSKTCKPFFLTTCRSDA
jgi:hypothetical protein